MHHFDVVNYNFAYHFIYNLHQQHNGVQCNFVIFFYYTVFNFMVDLYSTHFNAVF